MKEAAYIDSLAKEYYDYYYGENAEGDPAEIDELIMGDSINDQIQSYAAVAEPSEIIKMLGYTYSASQIGLQLAKIGALMSLSTALPFVQMLSIITGAGLLILAMIVSYCSVAVGVNQQLGLWYVKHINSMEEARQISIRVAAEEKRGYKFWYAGLANWFGLGGIKVGAPIANVTVAVGVVRINDMNQNVFAVNISWAERLARESTDPGTSIEHHTAHEKEGLQALNVPHFHARVNGDHGKCHIFYPGTY